MLACFLAVSAGCPAGWSLGRRAWRKEARKLITYLRAGRSTRSASRPDRGRLRGSKGRPVGGTETPRRSFEKPQGRRDDFWFEWLSECVEIASLEARSHQIFNVENLRQLIDRTILSPEIDATQRTKSPPNEAVHLCLCRPRPATESCMTPWTTASGSGTPPPLHLPGQQ